MTSQCDIDIENDQTEDINEESFGVRGKIDAGEYSESNLGQLSLSALSAKRIQVIHDKTKQLIDSLQKTSLNLKPIRNMIT